MKDIFYSYAWSHLFMFLLLMKMLVPLAINRPVFFVLIGVAYVLIIFKNAIEIADFEMSAKGEIVKILEDNATARSIDVHININK